MIFSSLKDLVNQRIRQQMQTSLRLSLLIVFGIGLSSNYHQQLLNALIL